MKLPFVRSPYNYDAVKACEECCVEDFGPSLTQQHQTADSDINLIAHRFGLTGQLPNNVPRPTIEEFNDVFDYKSARDAIANANSAFMRMPAAIRARFDNDAGQFVDYCSDPDNIDELRDMGLAVPKKEPPPPETPPPTTTGPGGAGGTTVPPKP